MDSNHRPPRYENKALYPLSYSPRSYLAMKLNGPRDPREGVPLHMDIQHEQANSRFSIDHDGQKSVLSYLMQGDGHIHFIRTWVPPEYRGSGHGAWLVKAGLDHARSQGLTVSTSCWFVDAFVGRNPAYADLMSEQPGPTDG